MILYHGTIESRGKKIVKDGKIDCHAERLNSESYEYIVENCMKVSEGSIKPKTLASTPGYTYCTNSLMYAIYYGNKNAILNNENEFYMYANELLGLGRSLTELAVKGTATAISNKIKTVKDEKNAEKLRATYDEIVNELLNEREEAVRIAQAYKSELDKVVISDEDIAHLHNTVSRILELLKNSGSVEQSGVTRQLETYEQIKELISVDTLKTMQLLGFNYKSAIGEPLTLMLRNFILSKVVEPDSLKTFEKMVTPEMVEILKDDTAYANFKKIMGMDNNLN